MSERTAIYAEVHDEADNLLWTTWLIVKPAVGEYLWLTGSERELMVEQFGTTSFQVKSVAHWCNSQRRAGTPIHSLCLYVEPVRRGVEERS